MNFGGFDYTDFILFGFNMTKLTLARNFTVFYTFIDSYSFRLNVVPTSKTKFFNLQICLDTKDKLGTSLQYSSDITPLNSNVYNRRHCLVWSTP